MLSFLMSRVGALLSAGLVAFLLVVVVVLTFSNIGKSHEINDLKAERVVLQRDLAQCHTNTVTLQGSLTEQNARIEALGAEQTRRETLLRRQAETAQANAAAANTRAQRILQTHGSSCEDADRIILENSR